MAEVEPIRTVGDLIKRLQAFDPNAPIRLQHAMSGTADFVVSVGPIPDDPEKIAIVYLAPPAGPGGQ